MADALRAHAKSTRATPQSEPARRDQVKNNAGGYVFATGDDTRLNRFLTIGTNGGTYHVTEKDLTRDNASHVVGLARQDYRKVITEAVKVSVAGRAPSNNPALYALAAAASLGSEKYRADAFGWLPQVARTGHHIMTFTDYAESMRGWGPQMVKGIGRWYANWDWREDREDGLTAADGLAYQLLKYKQRDGWSQRDMLRLAHFGRVPLSADKRDVFAYVMKGELGENVPMLVLAAAAAHATRKVSDWVRLVQANRSLSWEMLPSEALRERAVWEAMIRNGNVPQGALIRQLPRLTRLGVLKTGDSFTSYVAGLIASPKRLANARQHPVSLLLAMKTYQSGKSLRGKSTWRPVPVITDAYDAAFYASFPAVEPHGKRNMLAVDISGTMGQSAGGLPVTCREVVAGVAMATMAAEPSTSVWGFTAVNDFGRRADGITPLDISPRRRLDDIARYTSQLPMGRTDCALPMVHALRERIPVDIFTIYTDCETWAGPIHVHQALRDYREKMGINARLQVVCIVPTEFSIADPLDPLTLDVSGFDAAVPVMLANHGRGDLDPGAVPGPRQRDDEDGSED